MLEGIFAAVAGGGTGLLGSLVSDVARFFERKQEAVLQIQLKELDIKMLYAETDASIKIAKTEQETAEIEANARIKYAELEGFIAAQTSDSEILSAVAGAKNASTLLNIAAFVRTMVRPALTLYLCLLSTLVYMDARNTLIGMKNEMGLARAVEVYSDTSNQLIYLTGTAVLFWFGQRKRPETKLGK